MVCPIASQTPNRGWLAAWEAELPGSGSTEGPPGRAAGGGSGPGLVDSEGLHGPPSRTGPGQSPIMMVPGPRAGWPEGGSAATGGASRAESAPPRGAAEARRRDAQREFSGT